MVTSPHEASPVRRSYQLFEGILECSETAMPNMGSVGEEVATGKRLDLTRSCSRTGIRRALSEANPAA